MDQNVSDGSFRLGDSGRRTSKPFTGARGIDSRGSLDAARTPQRGPIEVERAAVLQISQIHAATKLDHDCAVEERSTYCLCGNGWMSDTLGEIGPDSIPSTVSSSLVCVPSLSSLD